MGLLSPATAQLQGSWTFAVRRAVKAGRAGGCVGTGGMLPTADIRVPLGMPAPSVARPPASRIA